VVWLEFEMSYSKEEEMMLSWRELAGLREVGRSGGEARLAFIRVIHPLHWDESINNHVIFRQAIMDPSLRSAFIAFPHSLSLLLLLLSISYSTQDSHSSTSIAAARIESQR